MLDKLLCKIGIHDYNYISEPELKNDIRKKMGLKPAFYGYHVSSWYCGIKICLKCNKVIDTLNSTILDLEEEKKEIERRKEEEINRMNMAKELYEKVAENK